MLIKCIVIFIYINLYIILINIVFHFFPYLFFIEKMNHKRDYADIYLKSSNGSKYYPAHKYFSQEPLMFLPECLKIKN